MTFQLLIVPSVMVGLSAGMFILEATLLGAVVRIPRQKLDLSSKSPHLPISIFPQDGRRDRDGEPIPRVRACRRNGALGAAPIKRLDKRRNEEAIICGGQRLSYGDGDVGVCC